MNKKQKIALLVTRVWRQEGNLRRNFPLERKDDLPGWMMLLVVLYAATRLQVLSKGTYRITADLLCFLPYFFQVLVAKINFQFYSNSLMEDNRA
jgi:hypothetical protein